MKSLETRRALVTGGTRGIGFATAEALVDAGNRVIVTGRLRDGRAPEKCEYLACDFSDRGALESFSEKVRELDLSILVNNAGVNKVGPLAEYDLADFERIQQVNLTASFLLSQAAIPGMRERRFGRIVNVTSVFGVVSKAGRFAYSSSKSGLIGLTRALAAEVAADQVLVNGIAPGFVDTELTRQVLGKKGIEEMIGHIPMGRLAKPDEIARCVRFLTSDENTYMTGQTIVVDGGFTSV